MKKALYTSRENGEASTALAAMPRGGVGVAPQTRKAARDNRREYHKAQREQKNKGE